MWERWVRRSLLGLTVVLTCFLVYLLATRVESVPTHGTSGRGATGNSEAGIDHFRFTQSRAGTVQWEVRAKRAQMFEGEKRAELKDVEVTLFGAQGWEMKLAGDEGTVDLAKKDFVLVNRVEPIVVQLQGGYTAVSNHLTWSDEQRKITTKDPVTISGHGLTVKGRGFAGKLDTEEFQVLENVHVDLVQ